MIIMKAYLKFNFHIVLNDFIPVCRFAASSIMKPLCAVLLCIILTSSVAFFRSQLGDHTLTFFVSLRSHIVAILLRLVIFSIDAEVALGSSLQAWLKCLRCALTAGVSVIDYYTQISQSLKTANSAKYWRVALVLDRCSCCHGLQRCLFFSFAVFSSLYVITILIVLGCNYAKKLCCWRLA